MSGVEGIGRTQLFIILFKIQTIDFQMMRIQIILYKQQKQWFYTEYVLSLCYSCKIILCTAKIHIG